MNTFFQAKPNRKWIWQGPNGHIKNEIDYILSQNFENVKNVNVLNKIKVSDHRMVRCSVTFNLKNERRKLVRKVEVDLATLREKSGEYKLKLQNKFKALEEKEVDSIEEMNSDFADAIIESSKEVGEEKTYTHDSKLSSKTKQLLKRRSQEVKR